MSLDLEDRLRQSLQRRAEDPMPFRHDVVGRFRRDERSHVVLRRVRRTAGTVLAASLAVGLTLAVPLPDALPAHRIGAPAASSPIAQGPTRGSLAGDEAWLAGFRDHVRRTFRNNGWRVARPRTLRVVFAGDVGQGRAAVTTFTVRRGPLETIGYAVWSGALGAAPDAMALGANGVGEDLPDAMTIAGDTGAGTGPVTYLAGPRATFAVSERLRYGTDGRVHRDWTPVPSTDGVARVPLASTFSSEVRVVDGGTTTYLPGPAPTSIEIDDAAYRALGARARAAAEQSRRLPGVPAPDLSVPAPDGYIDFLLMECRLLATDDVGIAMPWAGRIRGQEAYLVALTPRGGGTIFLSGRGITNKDSDGGIATAQELRLLVPADGATTRPIAWRLSDDTRFEQLSDDVAVVTQQGTARADLVSGGTVRPIALDAAGFAIVKVPLGVAASVRAYDAQGRLVGETPLPDRELDSGRAPGETRQTRLVD